MFSRLRSRTSSAHVISLIALFVALGGTGYAAVKLPRNSVSAPQIKTGGVGSSEVKNRALRAIDFKAGELPVGAKGDKGDPGTNGTNGAPGEPGSAAAFARVQPNGTVLPALGDFPAQSKNVSDANITNPAAGTYCFTGLPFRPASAVVASDNAGATAATQNNVVLSVAVERGNTLNGCPADANARVIATQWTEAAAPTNVNKGFIIWFEEG